MAANELKNCTSTRGGGPRKKYSTLRGSVEDRPRITSSRFSLLSFFLALEECDGSVSISPTASFGYIVLFVSPPLWQRKCKKYKEEAVEEEDALWPYVGIKQNCFCFILLTRKNR